MLRRAHRFSIAEQAFHPYWDTRSVINPSTLPPSHICFLFFFLMRRDGLHASLFFFPTLLQLLGLTSPGPVHGLSCLPARYPHIFACMGTCYMLC